MTGDETDRLELARQCYRAYESGDRGVLEELLANDFTFRICRAEVYFGWDLG